jgi:hypothetical protein
MNGTLKYALALIIGGTAEGLSALKVDHFDYEGGLSRKHQCNLPLLERCVAEFSDRMFLWLHLAEILLGLGRYTDAQAVGLRAVEAARQDQSPKSGVRAAMACQIRALSMFGRALDPQSIIKDALELHPGNHGLLLTMTSTELRFGGCGPLAHHRTGALGR